MDAELTRVRKGIVSIDREVVREPRSSARSGQNGASVFSFAHGAALGGRDVIILFLFSLYSAAVGRLARQCLENNGKIHEMRACTPYDNMHAVVIIIIIILIVDTLGNKRQRRLVVNIVMCGDKQLNGAGRRAGYL